MLAAVVRTGSVTGAARTLNVSAPAVTMQLRLLQEQLGLPLIERSPHGMMATEAGLRLNDAAERIEAILAECGASLGMLGGGERGRVSVGIVSTAKYFAPEALAAFARQHRGIELCLSVGNRSQIVEGLRRYELDVTIMGRPPQELDVDASVIGDHPHVVISRPDHRLAGRHALPPAALAEETFLVREPGSGTRLLMERFFAEAGIAPRFGMQIDSNETIKQAVIAGIGITFLSAHTVAAELLDGRLALLDVEGLPIVRQWYAVHLRERRLMPAMQLLRNFLTEEGHLHLPLASAGFTEARAGQ